MTNDEGGITIGDSLNRQSSIINRQSRVLEVRDARPARVLLPEGQTMAARGEMREERVGRVAEACVHFVVFELDVLDAREDWGWRGEQHFPFAPFDIHLEEIEPREIVLPETFGEINTPHSDRLVGGRRDAVEHKLFVRRFPRRANPPVARACGEADRYGADAIFEAVVADVRVERGKGGRKGLERHDARLGPKARGPDAEDAHVGAAVEDRLARLRQDIAAANKDLPEDFHFLGSRQRERSAAAQGYAKRVRAA